ncbi:MAG: DUF1847 domain-containing protein [Dorea sp.]|jgi:uncharacterized metal-binding protein|nr:DUF1847 domain-containing protein [Dorea sp.]
MEKNKLSCADCAVTNCNAMDKAYPVFCPTVNMEETVRKEALDTYNEDDNLRVMKTAAEVEHEGYMQWCRVQEIIEFAKKMGYRKLGIATCVGLIRETKILTDILRSHGFEVFGIACKAGAVPKVEMGIDACCCDVGVNMCNPILQAKMLNKKQTDMNIVMGLCVGHDSLFYKYSEALVTTLVAKDRVMGHNPAAALYTSDSYYKGIKNNR